MVEVFLVDDEPLLIDFYEKILSLNGFKVVGVAENGEDAVRKFKSFKRKPEVILMDHRMPEKTGLEASKEILQIDKSVKIIFLSADLGIKEEALSIGAFSFRVKPFSKDQLLNELEKAVNSHKNSVKRSQKIP